MRSLCGLEIYSKIVESECYAWTGATWSRHVFKSVLGSKTPPNWTHASLTRCAREWRTMETLCTSILYGQSCSCVATGRIVCCAITWTTCGLKIYPTIMSSVLIRQGIKLCIVLGWTLPKLKWPHEAWRFIVMRSNPSWDWVSHMLL